jgi:nucleoside-diphosphate-sugar epimerase
MKRILVTGSSGFIGTNLMSILIKDNDVKVLGIDMLPPKIKSQNEFWVENDFRDKDSLTDIVDQFKPNIVIHLGARTDLNGKTLEDYSSNTVGVSNLISVLNNIGGVERIVFASSMYVCIPGYIPSSFDDYKPHTVYGDSKVMTEEIIKTSSELKNSLWSIVRPTSIWGPWFGEPYKNFFDVVLSGKYLHMGSKACSKTYGYIDNTIFQILKLIANPKEKVHKKVFYLGDYESYDISEWADELASCRGIKILNVPFLIFKLLAYTGDVLKLLKINFPMTSFRLNNMTTNNIHDLTLIKDVAGELPVSRKKGVKVTIDWILKSK